jgi:hypothetical protein
MLTACRFLVLGVSLLASSLPLQALSAKVFVTPLGKDAANCGAFLSPCKTFAGAVAAVSPGGTVVVLTSGEYGAVTITKALTIQADGVSALVSTNGIAVTINAGSTDLVTLRGLVLTNPSRSGTGVLINSAGAVHIEKCVLSGFIEGVDAYAWSAGQLFVTETTARNNDEGIRITSPATPTPLIVSVERCVFVSNTTGIIAEDGTQVTVRGSVASGGWYGFVAQAFAGGSVELTVSDCLAHGNTMGAGIQSEGDSGSALVRVSGSTVTDNQRGLVQQGSSTLLSRGDNTVEGNAFGDLAGSIQSYSGK